MVVALMIVRASNYWGQLGGTGLCGSLGISQSPIAGVFQFFLPKTEEQGLAGPMASFLILWKESAQILKFFLHVKPQGQTLI